MEKDHREIFLMRHAQAGIFWLLSLLAPFAQAASLLDMVVQDQSVTFTLTQVVQHSLFSLEPAEGKSYRVVIDLPGTRLSGRVASPEANHPLVQNLRLGVRNNNDLRVVLDLKGQAQFSGEWRKAKGEARLTVNLAPLPGFTAPPSVSPSASTITILPSPPKPAYRPPAATAPAPAPLAKRLGREVVVAVDAGHGGIDPGALGRNGTHEKQVVFAISRELAALIEQAPGMRAVLIRDGDYFLSLRQRTERARQYQADLFVSIHADAGTANLRGASVYMLSQQGASSEAARWLAEKENSADLVGGVSLSDKDDILASVLLDLSQAGTLEASGQLGGQMLDALNRAVPVHLRKVQQANFMVLRSPDIPSVLVEVGFISNPAEEQKLKTPVYQKQLAQSLFDGIRAYLVQHAPPGTLLARQ
jgi:N-acetylmuramoyl-L-alanine amidase